MSALFRQPLFLYWSNYCPTQLLVLSFVGLSNRCFKALGPRRNSHDSSFGTYLWNKIIVATLTTKQCPRMYSLFHWFNLILRVLKTFEPLTPRTLSTVCFCMALWPMTPIKVAHYKTPKIFKIM